MFYCNDFNSLSVLSLYEGDLLGVVDKLYFSKNLKKLEQIELVGEDGLSLILPTKNIYKVGKNAITVKNNQAVLLKTETNNLSLCPINSKAYTLNGEFLGIVKEISFNEKFITQKISLDNNETLDVESVASCGKNTIIFNKNNFRLNIKKFEPIKTPKEFKTENLQVASTLPTEPKQEVGKKLIVNNTDFLLGRKCSKDILNFNNEILIKANSVVNKRNLKEIKKYGKIRELMLYIK